MLLIPLYYANINSYAQHNPGSLFALDVSNDMENHHAGPYSSIRVVLIVDGEPLILGLVRMIVESLGFKVLDASGGRAGLDVCHNHPGPIHLLLLDGLMPEIDGRQLAAEALKVRPGLKILFMSGYPGDLFLNGTRPQCDSFIGKPFNVMDLKSAVLNGFRSNDAPANHGTRMRDV